MKCWNRPIADRVYISVKDARRHHRLPFVGTVRVSWETLSGEPRFSQCKCIDVSEAGLRIEMPVSVPLRTRVSVSAERIKIAGSGSVKHVARYGAKYVIGVELTEKLLGKTLDVIREPWALRSPTPV